MNFLNLPLARIRKVKYTPPKLCPICLKKYIPTKQSKDLCLFCKRGIFIRADLVRIK